jgi:hypothetical protein
MGLIQYFDLFWGLDILKLAYWIQPMAWCFRTFCILAWGRRTTDVLLTLIIMHSLGVSVLR